MQRGIRCLLVPLNTNSIHFNEKKISKFIDKNCSIEYREKMGEWFRLYLLFHEEVHLALAANRYFPAIGDAVSGYNHKVYVTSLYDFFNEAVTEEVTRELFLSIWGR